MVLPFIRNPLFWTIVGVALMGAALILTFLPTPAPISSPAPEFHLHADFAVFINGEKMDFAQEKYMSETAHKLSSFVHLHDMDGTIIHVHKEGITLGTFFESLGMKLETTDDTITFTTDTKTSFKHQTYSAPRFGCFDLDAGQAICRDPTPDAVAFQFVINGQPFEGKLENYVMRDLDRILITYGKISETNALAQFAQVTDAACIQSGKCPERGEPSDERTCTTSGGCAAGPIAGAS